MPRMSFPIYMDMPGVPFVYNNMMDSQHYFGEALPMEMMEAFWSPNLVDPVLRGASDSMAYYQECYEPEQSQMMQRYRVEQQKTLFSTEHMSFQRQQYQKNCNKAYEATSPIPSPCEQAQGSSSTCSSATSPCTDNDWFRDNSQLLKIEEGSLSRSSSIISQGTQQLIWPVQSPSAMALVGHLSLSTVQGFADPQEVTFQDDEGYMDVEMKMEAVADTLVAKTKSCRGHYQDLTDEGIGQSLKDEVSPAPNTAKPEMTEDADNENKDNSYGNDNDNEADAEGEDVDAFENIEDINEIDMPFEEESIDADADADADYSPRTVRSKRRRSPRTGPQSTATKRCKITKPVRRSSKHQCKSCKHLAKDGAALMKHIAANHTRPYICTFSFAGCRSTFGNKNEWKRHVSSQHLGAQYWLCDVGSCSQSKSSTASSKSSHANAGAGAGASRPRNSRGNEFNRKDLFTQHVRRMHTPLAVKRQQKKNAEWEGKIKALQSSCLRLRRHPPAKTRCPVHSCAQIFEGPSSWDDRMEHVGRHFEKMAANGNASSTSMMTTVSPIANGAAAADSNAIIEQESDEFLVAWAEKERIIERRENGTWRLCDWSGALPNDEVEGNEKVDADHRLSRLFMS